LFLNLNMIFVCLYCIFQTVFIKIAVITTFKRRTQIIQQVSLIKPIETHKTRLFLHSDASNICGIPCGTNLLKQKLKYCLIGPQTYYIIPLYHHYQSLFKNLTFFVSKVKSIKNIILLNTQTFVSTINNV